MTAFRRVAGSAALGLALAACAGSPSPSTNATAPPGGGGTSAPGGGGGHGITFTVQVAFTGLDAVQGSFVDPETGTGIASCAVYASTAEPVIGWVSPSPPTQPAVQVAGKTLSFLWQVGSPFHGPATYSGTGVVGPALVVGSDTFFGSGSSVTVNADGSGNGSFTNLSNGSGGQESGTVTWTCAG